MAFGDAHSPRRDAYGYPIAELSSARGASPADESMTSTKFSNAWRRSQLPLEGQSGARRRYGKGERSQSADAQDVFLVDRSARSGALEHRRTNLSSTWAMGSRGFVVATAWCSGVWTRLAMSREGWSDAFRARHRGLQLEGLALAAVVYTHRAVANAKLTAFRLTEADRAYLDTLEDKLGFSKTDVVRLALRRLAELEGLELIKKSDPRRPARRV